MRGEQNGKNNLVVDDAMFMRKMLKDILTQAGYDVVGEAEDGDMLLQVY